MFFLGVNIAVLRVWIGASPNLSSWKPPCLSSQAKYFLILFRAEEAQIADLEAAGGLTIVVRESRLWVKQLVEVCLGMYEFGVWGDEVTGFGPQRGKGAHVVYGFILKPVL